MKILAIETSCDETGICILHYKVENGAIELCGNALASQIDIHAQYGGVFPSLAKRAHAEKFVPLLKEAMKEADVEHVAGPNLGADKKQLISEICAKDEILGENLSTYLQSHPKPEIDYIAVTVGPGLEPALWVGVTAAKVLSAIWDIPVIPINHMEGHIVTAAIEKTSDKEYRFADLAFPVLSLLVSGGHTELVIAEQFGSYKKIGQTRDDAVGEAFDKVARMLGLPYPGGPAVSKLAAQFREKNIENQFTLPRPMLHSQDYDFSFSGIKTATLYAIRDHGELNDEDKMALAAAFEDAAVEVLIKKTIRAAQEYGTPTVIVGGGVAGNTYLRAQLSSHVEALAKTGTDITVLFPEQWLATDNAVMIGMAAMVQVIAGEIKISALSELKADGNLSL